MTATANHYTVCAGSGDFLIALRAVLGTPRRTVWVQFCTFEGDDSGHALAELLLAQAAGGAQVRLVLDHYSDAVANDILPVHLHRRRELAAERARTRALIGRLRAGGVEIRRTAPLGRGHRFVLYRDHKKLVVVDGQIAFTGGLNVSDHNFGWNDFMVRIEGPLVTTLAADFDATWYGVEHILDPPADGVARDGDYAVNQSAARPLVIEEIVRLVDTAERSVHVETPSLLGAAIEDALLRAARRGVEITVVLPARHNRGVFRLWQRAVLRRLRHPNVALRGYRAHSGMTHAKLLLVDGHRAVFGSANLFELEWSTQKELIVVSSDVGLVSQLAERFDADLAHAPPLPLPRSGFGRFTYRLLRSWVRRETRRGLTDPDWRRTYC